jgi:transposase-like protein
MALTDNEKEKSRKRDKKKFKNAVGNTRYSDQQKLEAATAYLAIGNLSQVSRTMGIPEVTLRVWKATDWWKDLVDELKMQERIELSARMKKMIEASHILVAQRLETGDPIMTPKGEIVYKPVSMKDAHKVAIDLIDRRKEVEKMAVDNTPSEKEDDRKLEKLAERFAEMATMSIQKNFNKQRTIEGDVTDAVYEERKEGLQEGVPTLSQPTGTDQGED